MRPRRIFIGGLFRFHVGERLVRPARDRTVLIGRGGFNSVEHLSCRPGEFILRCDQIEAEVASEVVRRG